MTGVASAKYRDAFPAFASLWDDDMQCWVVRTLPGEWSVQVMPLLFTAAVVVARPGRQTYEDRWCYESVPAAVSFATAWEGPYPGSEPAGWHRHPTTGRRRPEGDAREEYVEP